MGFIVGEKEKSKKTRPLPACFARPKPGQMIRIGAGGAGMQLLAEMPDGRRVPLWVEEVREDEVILTRNHPLAGVTLHFAVEIVDVRDASPAELEQGHPAVPDSLPEGG